MVIHMALNLWTKAGSGVLCLGRLEEITLGCEPRKHRSQELGPGCLYLDECLLMGGANRKREKERAATLAALSR